MSVLPVPDRQILVRKAYEDARQYVYRVIKTCILNLFLPPSRKLSEASLAKSLDVSRTPVHDTFFKLSRENLVDIYPKRGAYVSRIDPKRIEQSVWTHIQLGTSMLNAIYIKKPDHSQLMSLRCLIRQLDDGANGDSLHLPSRIITEYYHQLYVLGGNMDILWNSLQKIDVDLYRLLSLAAENPVAAKGFYYELANLTDSLMEQDGDRACQILTSHFSRILLLVSPIQAQRPGYFKEIAPCKANPEYTK